MDTSLWVCNFRSNAVLADMLRKFSLFAGLFLCFPTIYRIKATLNPEKHSIRSIVDINWIPGPSSSIQFPLHSNLTISRFLVENQNLLGNLKKEKISTEGEISFYRYTLPLPEKLLKIPARETTPLRILIEYAGTIYDPVKPSTTATFVVGDFTSGLIGTEGIFLSESTRWYPRMDFEPSLFDVEISVPQPWVIVGQGDFVQKVSTPDSFAYRFSSSVPFDSYAISGGKYVVNSIRKNGILLSTYFFESEAHLSELFLNKVAEYLEKYSRLLTPYPYKKFDIVENFFTTGYGFPTYTLLGKQVIQMGERALRPGYLDHELVHCWFGNYLYSPPDEENWVEGLTTYFANYYTLEEQSADAGKRYRFGLAQKYSTRVKADRDYPLRKFAGKREDFENDIGYGKSAMVFHLIRRLIGDDTFFIILREMLQQKGGTVVRWQDFLSAYEAEIGASLDPIIHPWLNLPGLPSFSISSADLSFSPDPALKTAGEWMLTLTIALSPPLYILPLPFRIDYGDESEEGEIWIKGEETTVTLRLKKKPISISLDPDYHLLSEISREHLPPSLNTLLYQSEQKLAILPDIEEPQLQPLIDRIHALNIPLKTASDISSSEELDGVSLILLGTKQSNKWISHFLPPSIRWEKEAIEISKRAFTGRQYALLYSFCFPEECGKRWVTIYGGNSPEALQRSHLLFYYGWEPFVVFENGLPVFRAETVIIPSDRHFSFYDKAVITPSAERMRSSVQWLSSAEFSGRQSGTEGERLTADWLEQSFRQIGLLPWSEQGLEQYRIPVTFSIPSLSVKFTVTTASKKSSIPLYPLNVSGISGASSFRGIYYSESPELLIDPPVKPSLFAWKVPPKYEKKLWELLPLWQEGKNSGALAGVLLLLPSPSPFPPEWFSHPANLFPGLEKKFEEMKQRGTFASLPLHIASRLSSLEMNVPENFSLPVFAMPISEWMGKVEGQEERQGWRKEITGNWVIKGEQITIHSAGNVVGKIPGWDRGCEREVVLGAHYDHLGEGFPGGVDNASGVAVLLELARLMRAEPAPCPVIFIAFSAEEWGLRGSRALVSHLPHLERIALMLNLDSVGATDSPSFYLIGRSHHPQLASLMEKMLGVPLQPDIDRYAYEFGSDFYPFSAKGIPALGIWDAKYEEMHLPSSGAEKVRPEKLSFIAHSIRRMLFSSEFFRIITEEGVQ